MTNTPGPPSKANRPPGRPKRADAPEVDYPDLDKLLVFGEVVPVGPDGSGGTNVVYPSYRDLAKRFGLSLTAIAEYARSHNCMRRRETAQLRTQARVEEKLVERRADEIAMGKEEQLVIIDSYLAGFKTALAEGRVRYDSPADFNTMARLREFLVGGAEARRETGALPSLERLQELHAQSRRALSTSPAARGVAEPRRSAPPGATSTPEASSKTTTTPAADTSDG